MVNGSKIKNRVVSAKDWLQNICSWVFDIDTVYKSEYPLVSDAVKQMKKVLRELEREAIQQGDKHPFWKISKQVESLNKKVLYKKIGAAKYIHEIKQIIKLIYKYEKQEYCNLEPKQCKEHGRVGSDVHGYICMNCGRRVSKWLPLSQCIADGL